MQFSMNVLKAFVAVGRTNSFTQAARDLSISQSAVSRHVGLLEEHLGSKLFDRSTRRCALTSTGDKLFVAVDNALTQIDTALSEAKSYQAETTLSVSVSPFLSVEWFTPRLIHFAQAHPELGIKLTHSYHPPDFESERIDVGLNWSTKPTQKDLCAMRIVKGDLTPVCSPGFAERHLIGKDPSAVLLCQLFHEFDERDWKLWGANASVDLEKVKSQQISDTSALRKIALSGQGLCLLISELVTVDIAEGRLVAPFPVSLQSGSDYWLTYPKKLSQKPALKRFVRWLSQQKTPM